MTRDRAVRRPVRRGALLLLLLLVLVATSLMLAAACGGGDRGGSGEGDDEAGESSASDTVEGEQQALDEISADPLWSRLPAVRDGNVVVFDRLGYPGARGQVRFLEELAAVFEPDTP